MQDQQRDRYLSRKTLNSTSQSNLDNDDRIQTDGVLNGLTSEDDLGLRTHSETNPPSPGQPAIKHASEVSFLQKEIERLQLQISELNVAVAQKTREVSEMRSQMEEKEALGGGSSKATQRIVELSRRNRELMSELAVEKNRVRQLQRELQEAITKMTVQAMAPPVDVASKAEGPDDKLIIARLQDELSEAKQKSADYSNQCQQLKQELKVAHKTLLREVGDAANLQGIIGGASGWRGRAQQIATLQAKVAELKRQLQPRAPSTASGGGGAEEKEEKSKPEERQKAAIRKMEEERKKRLDEIRSELQSLQESYSKSQQQNNALKARNKTLAEDARALKAQVAALLEKETKDKALIQKLMEDTGLERHSVTDPPAKLEETNRFLQLQLDKCRTELETLRKLVSQSREEPCDGEHTSCPSVKLKDASLHSDASTFLPPIKLPHSTKGSVRKSISAGYQQLRNGGDIDKLELQTLLQVMGVEKDRLLELTAVLQGRLDESTDRCMKIDTELRTCKQRITELEKQIFRQPTSKCGKPTGTVNTSDESTIADLRSQLTVQLDENCVLKETLTLIRHEKMEDMKMLHRMLQETKMMFSESINVLRENKKMST